jgi:general secretion pathway protein K
MRRKREGIALIAALWLVVALAGIAFEVASSARDGRLAVMNGVDRARAIAAAEAGIETARARLTAPIDRQLAPTDDPWAVVPAIGPDTLLLGDVQVVTTVRDANSRVPVNVAPVEQLRRLAAALGSSDEAAARLAANIVAWRDPDTVSRVGGTERAAYLAAGRPVLPRDGPLVRIEELRDLYDMSPDMYALLAPRLTLRGSGAVNVNTAERAVLLSVPGLDRGVVDAIMRLRGRGTSLRDFDALVAAVPVAFRTALVDRSAELEPLLAFAVRTVEVESVATMSGSPVRARVAVTMTRGGGVAFVSGRRVE